MTITSNPTPVDRPLTRILYEDKIEILNEWLRLLKNHTENGSILALIDLALEGKNPTEEDYIKYPYK